MPPCFLGVVGCSRTPPPCGTFAPPVVGDFLVSITEAPLFVDAADRLSRLLISKKDCWSKVSLFQL